jgi:hypothetical protein
MFVVCPPGTSFAEMQQCILSCVLYKCHGSLPALMHCVVTLILLASAGHAQLRMAHTSTAAGILGQAEATCSAVRRCVCRKAAAQRFSQAGLMTPAGSTQCMHSRLQSLCYACCVIVEARALLVCG